MSFFVTADGGLTTAGYVGCVVLMVALVVIASVLSASMKHLPEQPVSAQSFTTCCLRS